VELDFAFGRLGFEIRCGVANLQRHGNLPLCDEPGMFGNNAPTT
jgi:hypothetical protein